MDWIFKPWPWYFSGPMISFIMFLLIMVGKRFGMSSNLRTLCTICGAGKNTDFFNIDWKAQKWNLIVVLGAIIGGFIGAHFLSEDTAVLLNPDTVANLKSTSGHAISGLSNLQLPSLIAVIGFFIGGLVMIHFIYPLIF